MGYIAHSLGLDFVNLDTSKLCSAAYIWVSCRSRARVEVCFASCRNRIYGQIRLGQRYFGDLFTGTAAVEEEFMGGPRLINNRTFDDLTDTKRYIIGEGFGILTDIQTDPNGDLYVVSL